MPVGGGRQAAPSRSGGRGDGSQEPSRAWRGGGHACLCLAHAPLQTSSGSEQQIRATTGGVSPAPETEVGPGEHGQVTPEEWVADRSGHHHARC